MTKSRKWALLSVIFAVILGGGAGARFFTLRDKSRRLGLNRYDYRQTRRLVATASRAADRLAEKGDQAFEIFLNNAGEWSLGGFSYLYVYTMDGVNLFHGGYRELAGKNLIDFTDLLGKKPGRLIIDQLENHRRSNPHGWIHYLWVPPGFLDGIWKSSCNFLATMPDGRRVFVGAGIDNLLPEREFYRIIVDQACRLLEREGKSCFPRLQSPAGPFTIHDTGIFVIDRNGTLLSDPGLNLGSPRNLLEYRDLTGNRPLLELSEKLNSSDSAWVIVLNEEKASNKPVKKGIYGRRATMDGEEVIVGAICPLPRPVWMR